MYANATFRSPNKKVMKNIILKVKQLGWIDLALWAPVIVLFIHLSIFDSGLTGKELQTFPNYRNADLAFGQDNRFSDQWCELAANQIK